MKSGVSSRIRNTIYLGNLPKIIDLKPRLLMIFLIGAETEKGACSILAKIKL